MAEKRSAGVVSVIFTYCLFSGINYKIFLLLTKIDIKKSIFCHVLDMIKRMKFNTEQRKIRREHYHDMMDAYRHGSFKRKKHLLVNKEISEAELCQIKMDIRERIGKDNKTKKIQSLLLLLVLLTFLVVFLIWFV